VPPLFFLFIFFVPTRENNGIRKGSMPKCAKSLKSQWKFQGNGLPFKGCPSSVTGDKLYGVPRSARRRSVEQHGGGFLESHLAVTQTDRYENCGVSAAKCAGLSGSSPWHTNHCSWCLGHAWPYPSEHRRMWQQHTTTIVSSRGTGQTSNHTWQKWGC